MFKPVSVHGSYIPDDLAVEDALKASFHVKTPNAPYTTQDFTEKQIGPIPKPLKCLDIESYTWKHWEGAISQGAFHSRKSAAKLLADSKKQLDIGERKYKREMRVSSCNAITIRIFLLAAAGIFFFAIKTKFQSTNNHS